MNLHKFYAIDNIVGKVTFLTDLTASYCNKCHPMLHFVDADLIRQEKNYFDELDIVQLLRDIQWDFKVCFKGLIRLNLSRKCSIIDSCM